MGARKRNTANKRKEERKNQYFAVLRNCPTSPRKMRLVADMIRGVEVHKALGLLKFSTKEAAGRLEKLLRSAISNWEQKTEQKAEDANKAKEEASRANAEKEKLDIFSKLSAESW